MPARTVLVIDDEEPIRDAVRMVLEEEGYAVLEAPDGRDGLKLLRTAERPLVVLLDLMMPGMSGIRVLRAVAAEPAVAARHAYIIFSAASAFSAPTLNLYLPGKDLFDLPKPFSLDDLSAVVGQAALQLSGERDEEQDEADVGETVQAKATASDADSTSGGA